MRAFALCKCYDLKHNYVTKALWHRRNMLKKVHTGVSQPLIYKLSVGTDNALYLISTAILRNLEIFGGIPLVKRVPYTSDVLWISHEPF